MLEIMADKHGFSVAERYAHIRLNHDFLNGFMWLGTEQIAMLSTDKAGMLLDSIAEDSLKDMALW
jgi:hypothetical protein